MKTEITTLFQCFISSTYNRTCLEQVLITLFCERMNKWTLANIRAEGQVWPLGCSLLIPIWDYPSNGSPLQYSCLENPMDRGAWWAAVHGVAKSRTRLSHFTFTFHFHALEKEMATHSSVLAWRIPGTGEPGGLQSMGSHRVGHDWSDLAAAVRYFAARQVLFFLFFITNLCF